jgi:hypothetical protein
MNFSINYLFKNFDFFFFFIFFLYQKLRFFVFKYVALAKSWDDFVCFFLYLKIFKTLSVIFFIFLDS